MNADLRVVASIVILMYFKWPLRQKLFKHTKYFTGEWRNQKHRLQKGKPILYLARIAHGVCCAEPQTCML